MSAMSEKAAESLDNAQYTLLAAAEYAHRLARSALDTSQDCDPERSGSALECIEEVLDIAIKRAHAL